MGGKTKRSASEGEKTAIKIPITILEKKANNDRQKERAMGSGGA